jgi:NAD(P)-dependent dehydrogenase (short-subunit alcohol dehydrogenase family)
MKQGRHCHRFESRDRCGRLGEPEDIAGAVLLFCVDGSRFVTGSYLRVCGGAQMS